MGQKEITSKRIEWADMARSFAVFCVISCHTVEEVYPFDVSSMMAISFQARILVFGWMILGRLGVPIFFANSHFPRPAEPHFPASQGHIKRPA